MSYKSRCNQAPATNDIRNEMQSSSQKNEELFVFRTLGQLPRLAAHVEINSE